jgi:hypothetical protein
MKINIIHVDIDNDKTYEMTISLYFLHILVIFRGTVAMCDPYNHIDPR